MVTLKMAGSLDRCATLPRTLDLQALREVFMWGESEREAMREVAEDAVTRKWHKIAEAIADGLRRYADPALEEQRNEKSQERI